MKKITLSLLFGFISFFGFSQIGLVENFDLSLALPAGWTSTSYSGSVFQQCNIVSFRSNLSGTNTTDDLTSFNIVGESNGSDLTVTFDYKIVDWSAAVDATPPGWGELNVQYSTNNGGTWTTMGTVNDANHVTANTCANMSFVLPAASIPNGSDFKLRFENTWSSGDYYFYIDNVTATQVVVDPPSCVDLTTPLNGATGVAITANLAWEAATGIPTGYTLTVGTTPGGTDIVDNLDVGLSTMYDLPDLEYSTTYYVTILPYNANGPAVNCQEQSFTTGADPNAPVDCGSGIPINTVFCYTNNDNTTFSFISSDGSPLVVVFNSGSTENNWDELIVLDSDGVTNLNTATPYGNAGNLAGLQFVSSGDTITVGVTSDGSGVSCTTDPWDFDVFCVDTTALPNCNATLTDPLNGATGVSENTDLTWSAASVFVTGYKLFMGTTPGGTDIIDGVDVGDVLTYDLPDNLDYETTYYVTIIPYNDNGYAENCNEESFTTRLDPNQIIDCANNQILNTVFCYENGIPMWTEIFSFQSSDGSPLNMFFNSGTIENCCDTIRLEEGDGTLIYEGTGAAGNLAGLSLNSTSDRIVMFYEADGSVSCSSGSREEWDFDVSCIDTSVIPNCNANLTEPLNGAVDVSENTDLTWSPATVFVTGYTLYMGTTPGGTDVLNGVDVGNVLTYDLGTLDYETTYYVTIIPYNDNGPAENCNEGIFTVRSDPNQIIDCANNQILNTVFCYENGIPMWTEIFSFQSSDGSPLNMFFNSGTIETCCDTIRIEEGDGTLIYEGTGNAGDLAGLSLYSNTDRMVMFYEADGSVSCSSGSRVEWDFDVSCFDATAPPNCNADLVTPADGEIDVAINSTITWSPASIIVTGYTISIGTTPEGIDIADNVDVGDVLTYDPGVLDNATTYYVTVTPYNDNGPATDCTEQSFKTICIPHVVTFNAIGDCDTDPNNPDFVLEVNVADLSGAASIIITDDQGSPAQTATTTGIITMGPYAANTVVTITTIKSDDDTCDVISSPITFICPPPPNLCSIVYAGEDDSVDCDESTDLTAVYHLFGQDTNNYVINGLDTCPLPSTVGGTSTSINTDDVWSDIINIGFEFCFFGEVYDQILIGSNGVLSFEIENAGGYNGWPFTETLPNSTNGTLSEANIFGVGHDIDPSVCGDINYLVIGTAPYRMFVVNYTGVCHFSCNDLVSSSQIILYESSNNIDINVFEKPTCSTWNSGNAVIGVQNIAGDIAFTPPARNTGPWSITEQESWRFAPYEDTPSFVFEWFDGATSLGNTETITVSPSVTTTYTASITYDLCTGGTATITDDVTVTVEGSQGDASFTMTATCDGATAEITGDEGGTFAFNPEPGDGAVIDPSTGEITGGVSGMTYTVEYVITGDCGATSTQEVTVLDSEDASFIMNANCDGGTAEITGTAGGTFAFNPEPGDGAVIDPSTGEITGGVSGMTYTVEYTTSDSECSATSTQDVTVLDAEDASFTMTATCDGGTATITGTAGGTFAFNPEPGDGAVIDPSTGEITGGVSGMTYTVEYTTSDSECSATSMQDVTVLPAEDASFIMTATCDGGIAEITGTTGGTFAFNPEPGDGAVIDPSTGEITGGVSGMTYTVEYTTSDSECSATSTQDVTVLDAEDASFTMTATCDGGTATITGTAGGTFEFNPEPGDGAVIDSSTGEITGGVSGMTYTVQYTTSGDCPVSSLQDVTVLDAEDASFTMTATCDGGTAEILGTTGGTFAFNPEPGDGATIDSSTGTITGGVSGMTYTVEYTTGGDCSESSTQNVTVLPAEDASFTMTATCDGGTAEILGTTGGTFAFNPEPGDGATIDSSTGTITGGVSGMTYTVEYTTGGDCSESSTQNVTVLPAEDASFTMTATCDGGTAEILGTTGGTFAFNPEPGDGATIDSSTGTITGGVSGMTYTVEYTTGGDCSESSTQNVTVLPAEDASFTLTTTCDGATATVTGDMGGTFAFNPEPGDGATIDPVTGTITGGSLGSTYDVEYTTSGPCPASSIESITVEDLEDPVAICNNITVMLGSNGMYMLSEEDIESIGMDSTDDCGIDSMSVSINNFTCEDIGENIVTLTVTDFGGNTSTCEATITVDGIIPSVEITETPLSVFCQGVILTAESDVTVTYLWSTGETTESIVVTENGAYGLTVTSETNCSTFVQYTVSSIEEGTPLSEYAIYAANDIFLHGENVVQSGGVGVGSYNGEIKLHQDSHIVDFGQAMNFTLNQGSTIGEEINEVSNPIMPNFMYNTQSNNSSPSITIENGDTQTLDGDVYDQVWVRDGATVIFSQPNVFINKIKTSQGANIEFEGCSNVYVNNMFILAKYGTINSRGNSVTIYVNNDVHVEKGSNVRAIIYSNGHQILAKGSNVNSNNPEPTYMTGLFIGNKVHGLNNVIWNSDVICDPCPVSEPDENRYVNFDVTSWPNPSDTVFNLRLITEDLTSDAIIEVFDMNNKLVHKANFKPEQKYSFGARLDGGVYIVKVSQANNSKIIRLVRY